MAKYIAHPSAHWLSLHHCHSGLFLSGLVVLQLSTLSIYQHIKIPIKLGFFSPLLLGGYVVEAMGVEATEISGLGFWDTYS